MSNEIIKYSRNLVQTISDTLALSDKLRSISEAERYFNLAQEERKNENYRLAKEYFLKALELHPRFHAAHLTIIAICLRMGEPEDALHYSELALKQFPENAAFLYSRGMINAAFFEKHEEAIADFSRAIELEQRFPVKRRALHECYLERSKSKEELGDEVGSLRDKMIYLQLLDVFERNNEGK